MGCSTKAELEGEKLLETLGRVSDSQVLEFSQGQWKSFTECEAGAPMKTVFQDDHSWYQWRVTE